MRLVRQPLARSFFLGLATLATALGFPVKVEPPPPRRTPVEVVRDGRDDDLDDEPPATGSVA